MQDGRQTVRESANGALLVVIVLGGPDIPYDVEQLMEERRRCLHRLRRRCLHYGLRARPHGCWPALNSTQLAAIGVAVRFYTDQLHAAGVSMMSRPRRPDGEPAATAGSSVAETDLLCIAYLRSEFRDNCRTINIAAWKLMNGRVGSFNTYVA